MSCVGTGGILNTFGRYLMKFFKYILNNNFGITISTVISIILYIYFVYSSRKEEEKTEKISKKLTFFWLIPFIVICVQLYFFVKKNGMFFNNYINRIRDTDFGLLILFFTILAIFNVITSVFAKKYFDAKILTYIISGLTFISVLFMFKSDHYLEYTVLIVASIIAMILGEKLYKDEEDKKLNRTLAIQFVIYMGAVFYIFLKMIDKILFLFFFI